MIMVVIYEVSVFRLNYIKKIKYPFFIDLTLQYVHIYIYIYIYIYDAVA